MKNEVTLYGAPNSLYTGRARSYLIKAGVKYREVAPNSPHFMEVVLPKAGGRMSMPTIELGDGDVVRDGAAIIDFFESENNGMFAARDDGLEVLARLFDAIGSEGLLRPAMHYRWNFDQQNKDFIMFHFKSLMPPSENREVVAEMAAQQMREASRRFGVDDSTIELVEDLYGEFLNALNAHFEAHPYILGGRPSIADFGMIAPLYGHLGRDPVSLQIMREKAVHVYRWVERMNRPDLDTFEYFDCEPRLFQCEAIPDSLVDVMRVLATDFVPETMAAMNEINSWLNEHSELEAGTKVARGIGQAEFQVRDVRVSALAQPYRFFLLSRVQDAFERCEGDRQDQVLRVLERSNMTDILSAKLSRNITRANNLEVWA